MAQYHNVKTEANDNGTIFAIESTITSLFLIQRHQEDTIGYKEL